MKAAVVALTLPAVLGHLCVVNPVQRGGFNISSPGDRSCFWPNAPCGSAPAANPGATIVGGEGFNLFFQQNLNHYNPGWPGIIDVAWSTYPEPPTDDNWTAIATIPDFWPHLQAQQTNFSVPVIPPNIACDHCVLRVRYMPNKPTEPIFHQCVDVRIVPAPSPPPNGRMFAFATAGHDPAVASLSTSLVEILPSGEAAPRIEFLRSEVDLVEGAATSLGTRIYSLVRTPVANPDNGPANALLELDVTTMRTRVVNITLPRDDPDVPDQFTAIVSATSWSNAKFTAANPPLVLLGLQNVGSYHFTYQARLLDPATGAAGPALAMSDPQDTFVNFMFATSVDPSIDTFYFLAGDENSLYTLDALLFTVHFDFASGNMTNMTAVPADNSQFTISSLHLDPATGAIYTVSPGLYAQTAWNLVTVNPATGALTRVGQQFPAGIVQSWYGGAVYGDAITADGSLLHLFKRVADDTLVLAKVDLTTAGVPDAPTLLNGVNGHYSFNTLTYVADAPANRDLK